LLIYIHINVNFYFKSESPYKAVSKPVPPQFSVSLKVINLSQALEAHSCNLSYSGGRDLEDHSLKPAQANSSRDSILKIHQCKKRAGRVAQAVEHLPSKGEVLSSNPRKMLPAS
jgi:hypothetical protein